jgi:hypothetical protein
MRRAILVAFGLFTSFASLSAQVPGDLWGDELGAVTLPESLLSRGGTLPAWPAAPLHHPPSTVRAVYVNAWAFGSSRFSSLVRLADSTEINSFVVDVKDDTGYLTYRSEVPTAIEIGANARLRARDAADRLRTLHLHGIHAIARIVVAKDPLLAARKPAWSVKDAAGGLWRDRLNFAWVDAFNDSVWVYASQLAAEAVKIGFDEVQFDYVRFPDEPRARMAHAIFSARQPGETTRDGVCRNLRLLRDRVKPLGVPFTIDVFGMTTNVEGDMGIGQIWEDLVTTADVVLPMVYPSHYYHAMYGVPHPNSEPYRVVKGALADAMRRNARLGRPTAEVRPYLQAFTLGRPRYTPQYIREQIQAAADLGIHGWVLWNARSTYDPGIFESGPQRATQMAFAGPDAGPGLPRSDSHLLR